MREKRIKSFLILTLMSLGALAQTAGYKYKTAILPVSQPGFYNVLLTPNLKAHIKTDYSDLRIVDSSGRWVPHLVRYPDAEKTKHELLWDLSILKIDNNKNLSEIIVATGKWKIYNLTFTIRSTNVERWGNLTGSEDSIHWFVVNDSIPLQPSISAEVGESEFVINFPANTYKFYKLSIANSGKAPYAITKVKTTYPADDAQGTDSLLHPFENPTSIVLQKDSGNISYITVIQQGNFHTDKIQLQFSGLKYFNRSVSLFIASQGDHATKRPKKQLANFTVSNNSSLHFTVPIFKDSIFYLQVYNDDNPALKLEQVKTFSNGMVATVYLEKNTSYTVLMGNETAALPNYDLTLRDINTSRQLPIAATGKVVALQTDAKAAGTRWHANKLLLWLVIIAAASALTFFTYRLVKDIGKSNNSTS